MKNLVNIEARVIAPNAYNADYKVELQIREAVKNPKFPQAANTYATFIPSGKVHMRKSTLDFLLLTQGKEVRFDDKEKFVIVEISNIPAEFKKGYKKTGERYYGIKANLSTDPNETHNKWFFADPMTSKMCETFVTEHNFIESQEVIDDEEDEETEEDE